MQTKLLRTSGFQIALFYLLLLSVTLLAVIAVVYLSTAQLIDRQMNETVEAEIRGLAEQYRDEGLPRLIEVIGERSGTRGDKQSVYLLANSMGQRLAGNLTSWPEGRSGADGWLEVSLHRSSEDAAAPHVIRGQAFNLTAGYRLFVGRDTEERNDFRRITVDAIVWALGPALVLGLAGGALIGRYSLRRVDAVRATSEDIVSGDLSRRVPLTGSGDEFDRLAQTINKMLDQIDALMTGMLTVTDSLAHDLRSPLTRAKSGIELALRKDGDRSSYREILEQTNTELEAILRTFESLVNIAQAEAGVGKLALGRLDLSALAGDLGEIYAPMAEESGLALTGDVTDGIIITGHRQLLGQAIVNLLDNAIKFTPAGGRIELSLTRQDGAPTLCVRDSGPGIPVDERERVLQRFIRLDNSQDTPGSGLGLSLAAAVAKLHGASLQLGDNEPGLTVTLTFPPA